jgi:hypothetical protein
MPRATPEAFEIAVSRVVRKVLDNSDSNRGHTHTNIRQMSRHHSNETPASSAPAAVCDHELILGSAALRPAAISAGAGNCRRHRRACRVVQRRAARANESVNGGGAMRPRPNESERRQSVAFKLSKQQLAVRDALASSLREKAAALNVVIVAFNQAIEPISRPVVEALDDYNAILEKARALSGGVTEAAHEEFDARSERWQQSDKGIQVRSWIEQWELNLDDVDLDVPEPLTEIDPDERALEIEGAPTNPTE